MASLKYVSSVQHRGGWRRVIGHAIRQGVLSTNNRGGQLMLLDCAEMWFVGKHAQAPWLGGMREPWVGMLHTTLHLPPGWPQSETLWGTLRAPAFIASLPWCRLLIVFSRYLARDLRMLVPTVPVAVLKHPVGMGTAALFNLQSFKARYDQVQVVFLGSQYRRLSTLLHTCVCPSVSDGCPATGLRPRRHSYANTVASQERHPAPTSRPSRSST